MTTEEQLREALQELLEANEDCEKTYNPWASIASVSRARDRYTSAIKKGKAALSQEQAQPMTDEQLNTLASKTGVYQYHPGAIIKFARAIEAHHGITTQASEVKV
jgi:hypothetical protein